MFSHNNKISVRQLQALLVLDVFGTAVIVMPRRAAEYAGQDGYLVIITSIVMAMVYTFLITSIGRKFPEESFFGYTGRIVTRPIAAILCVALIVKIIACTALELRLFGEVIGSNLLHETPIGVVCAVMLLISAYAAVKGYETRARVAEVLFLIVFVPLILIFCLALRNADFTNLQPSFVTPGRDILTGAFRMGSAFTGLEYCLLVHPYVRKPERVRAGSLFAILIIGSIMVFVTVVVISIFGPFDLVNQTWPVLELMDRIELPGGFIEGLGAVMMSIWILSIFAVINAGLYFSSLVVKDVIKKGSCPAYVFLCAAVIFVLSFIPRNIEQVYYLMDSIFIIFGVSFYIIIPLVLLMIASYRRRKT